MLWLYDGLLWQKKGKKGPSRHKRVSIRKSGQNHNIEMERLVQQAVMTSWGVQLQTLNSSNLGIKDVSSNTTIWHLCIWLYDFELIFKLIMKISISHFNIPLRRDFIQYNILILVIFSCPWTTFNSRLNSDSK